MRTYPEELDLVERDRTLTQERDLINRNRHAAQRILNNLKPLLASEIAALEKITNAIGKAKADLLKLREEVTQCQAKIAEAKTQQTALEEAQAYIAVARQAGQAAASVSGVSSMQWMSDAAQTQLSALSTNETAKPTAGK